MHLTEGEPVLQRVDLLLKEFHPPLDICDDRIHNASFSRSLINVAGIPESANCNWLPMAMQYVANGNAMSCQLRLIADRDLAAVVGSLRRVRERRGPAHGDAASGPGDGGRVEQVI